MTATANRVGILVVDDEKSVRKTLRLLLESEGWAVREAESAEDATRQIADEMPDLVLSDVRMGGATGIELLQSLRRDPAFAAVPVIIVSGQASIREAVEAIRLGANDFVEKPVDRDRVLVSVRNALRTAAMARELSRLEARVGAREEMIGDSPAMRRLYGEIEKVAPTRGRVLITGESGTGKELIARAVHRLSQRASGAFVKVNCAAIPHELIESELFGHEKGAFTGAVGRKRGHFEAAHGGTLFLDEIGDLPLAAQSKMLRALQQGEITRVGSDQVIQVDVRVIAATHRDLEADVTAGRFREDLYFRLNVVPLRSPPLRERREDLPALVTSFARLFCDENGFRDKPVPPDVLAALARRVFPGNVRELRNLVERMVILSGDAITMADLPDEGALSRRAAPELAPDASDDELPQPPRAPGTRPTLREFRDEAERGFVLETLREVDWNISRASAMLGLERTNLHKKMRALGIKREEG